MLSGVLFLSHLILPNYIPSPSTLFLGPAFPYQTVAIVALIVAQRVQSLSIRFDPPCPVKSCSLVKNPSPPMVHPVMKKMVTIKPPTNSVNLVLFIC